MSSYCVLGSFEKFQQQKLTRVSVIDVPLQLTVSYRPGSRQTLQAYWQNGHASLQLTKSGLETVGIGEVDVCTNLQITKSCIRLFREQRKNSKRGQPKGLVEIQKYQVNFQ